MTLGSEVVGVSSALAYLTAEEARAVAAYLVGAADALEGRDDEADPPPPLDIVLVDGPATGTERPAED